MAEEPKPPERRKDSTEIVAPFARIRIIVFLICMAVAVAVMFYRAFTG